MPNSAVDLLAAVEDLSFARDKTKIVHSLCQSVDERDNSRKGTFDREIEELLWYLNDLDQYVSTSSCSGRVIMFSQDGHGKGGCRWHLAHHSEFTKDHLVTAVQKLQLESSAASDVYLKFEPFILHVRCRTLADAQKLHAHSVQSGFRNSGITIRRKGKEGFAVHLAVRCTLNFEMPLVLNGQLLLNLSQVQEIAKLLVRKMSCNADVTFRFFVALKRFFPKVSLETNGTAVDPNDTSTSAESLEVLDDAAETGNE